MSDITRRSVLAAMAGGVAAAGLLPPAGHAATFEKLWRHHPMGDGHRVGRRWPCDNVLNIECLSDPRNIVKDQCTVRLGLALSRTFPNLKYRNFPLLRTSGDGSRPTRPLICRDLTKTDCAHHEDELHLLRTSEFASSLLHVSAAAHRSEFPAFSWLSEPVVFERDKGETQHFRSEIGSRSGIIFIENFWRCRHGLMHRSHIDLWNGALKRTKNELYYRGQSFPDARYEFVADRIVFWEVLEAETASDKVVDELSAPQSPLAGQ